jgi:HD-GYP domain-containing protein (c-di-GMP phosphodiesterase class II)
VKRARAKARNLLAKVVTGGHAELHHPAMEHALEEQGAGRTKRVVGREWRVELCLALTAVAANTALLLLAPWARSLDVVLAAALVVAYGVASRVRFHDGAGYTMPTQLVLVPMFLLLPPPLVPLLAGLAMVVGSLDLWVGGKRHPQRLVMGLGDSLYSVGPAIVLSLWGPADPSWHAWPIYLGALVAQFAGDFTVSALRDWLIVGLGADLALPLVAWTWVVDFVLSSVGLMAAIAAKDDHFAVLLILPVMALLAIFSRERDARIDQSLELSRAYRGTTLLLSDVLDGDDEYTAFHSRGVVQLSIAVSDRLGLDERQKRNVEFGALLHDVGKIAIPKEILNKPGKLTKDEWVVMETHTVEGQKLLDRVGGVLGEVGQIIRSSHERWDGSGYPDGLAGEAIPLESSIVSVCDAFNAMTTHRPYRRALTIGEATSELSDNSGTQFAPHVVDCLLELLDEEAVLLGPAEPETALDEITLAVPDALLKRSGG